MDLTFWSVVVLRILILALVACSFSLNVSSVSGSHPPSAAPLLQADTHDFATANKNKNKELEKEVKKVLKPVIILKNALESHLPQKEVRTLKRLAFKVMLLARRYL